MATESQRSEIMSGAPSSSEFASHRPAQTDVSADAALILAALGRMEAVVRDERAAFTRLRVMIGDMAQAIARAKTVADSETAATLLDELEHRVDAMIEIAGGHHPVAESAAIPDPQPPSSTVSVERDEAPPAHGASEAQHADATPAPDAGAVEQAIRHAAEYDQVPTVSDVVSRLGSDDETPPAAAALPPVDDSGISAPTVAMLTAMVEALRDSISAAALEPRTEPKPEPKGTQPLDVAPRPETSSIESAEVATPTAETAQAAEAAHAIEAPQAEAPQATEHFIEVAEATAIPPPADAASDQSPFVAMLRARLVALNATAATAVPESEALLEAPQPASQAAEDVAQPLDLAPQDSAPQPETAAIESAEVATSAAEIVQAAAEAAHLIEAPQAGEATPGLEAIDPADVADAAPIPRPSVSDVHESALLASLERMGARPFPPPDEGTAVIFAPKPESEFLPEFAYEPMALAETAPEPEQPVAPQHAAEPEPPETPIAETAPEVVQALAPEPTPSAAVEVAAADAEPATPIEPTAGPAAAAPSDAVAASETAESDFDPADFLFGPEPEPDPAAFLLDPAPPPAPRAKAAVLPQPDFVAPPSKPATENPEALRPAESDPPAQTTPPPAPHDPLRALKAMSENEKLALFS